MQDCWSFTSCLSWTFGTLLNVARLSLFCRYYFGRCSSELAELVPLSYSRGKSTRYSDRLHDFCVTISRYYKDVYVNNFFPHTARLWNSLPIECFPLTNDLNGFKSGINRHLLTVGSFWTGFLYASVFLCFFSCDFMPCKGCFSLEWSEYQF